MHAEPRREGGRLAIGQQIEHTSTPRTRTGGAGVLDAGWAFSTRSSVSALAPVPMPNARASRPPASPPSASPTNSSARASRVVRRA
jgi:hypothetical protein